jgi:T-complex protein 1 subunit gamma
MRKRIENPRVILLDCPLEYKKGESQTNLEVMKEGDFAKFLQLEEDQVADLCQQLIALKPDIVVTEKGCSDLAQHILQKAGVTCLRRLKKTDNNRLARVTGATIVNRVEDVKESDIGTSCGLFHMEKIDSEYFCFFDHCKDPRACTIVLRGASKDIINEVERNLQDAMAVARNLMLDPKLVPGGGASEMEMSGRIMDLAKSTEGTVKYPMMAVASALEVIPRTLLQNSGADPLQMLTDLRAKHSTPGNATFGVSAGRGISEIVDMTVAGVWEPLVVKSQTVKSALETACMLLRVDDIVAGIGGKEQKQRGGDDHEHTDACAHD